MSGNGMLTAPNASKGSGSGKRLIIEGSSSTCYFRTSVEDGMRKALVQITERCNLHCAHCFVNSVLEGQDISLDDYITKVLPRLKAAGVTRVTLTGGDPFMHPNIIAICQATVYAGMSVGLCTNATLTSDEQIAQLVAMGGVHVNVSFDGFRPETHGKFRGDRESFPLTVETTRKFAEAGLLQGLLSTPNTLTTPDEFVELCEFALEVGAYVLMNPLSPFGRGIKSGRKLQAPDAMMSRIRELTSGFDLDTVYIRFPNEDEKPLAGCDAGKIIYVFSNGDVAVCPYLVFAARNPLSKHKDTEFMAGNILQGDIADPLNKYDMSRLEMGGNSSCGSCSISGSCGKGCPAAVIGAGFKVGKGDSARDQLCSGPKGSGRVTHSRDESILNGADVNHGSPCCGETSGGNVGPVPIEIGVRP